LAGRVGAARVARAGDAHLLARAAAADAVLAGVLLAERHRAHHALARRVDGVVGRAVAVVVGARRAVAPRRLDGAHAGAPAAARAAVGRDAGARARAADADAVSQRVAAARLG